MQELKRSNVFDQEILKKMALVQEEEQRKKNSHLVKLQNERDILE